MSKYTLAYVFALVSWIIAVLFSIRFGAVPDATIELIMQLRVPRVLLASAVGMGLSVAGVTLQAIFANTLAEPYTIGVSSGAALGAVLGTAFDLSSFAGPVAIAFGLTGATGTAFAGALLFTAILYAISLRQATSGVTLLLCGVMLGFLGSSLIALWMALTDTNGIQAVLQWLLGDLSRARLQGSLLSLLSVLLLSSMSWRRWREMDCLLLGDEQAMSLGISVNHIRRRLMLISAMIIALCVSSAGMIGFIGLIVPHFGRRLVGSMHFRLIPLCAIFGAATLTAADGLSRILVRPYELPVGVITAIIGSPLFLWIMLSRRNRT